MSKNSNKAFADAYWLGEWEKALSIYESGGVDINQPERESGLTWLHLACKEIIESDRIDDIEFLKKNELPAMQTLARNHSSQLPLPMRQTSL